MFYLFLWLTSVLLRHMLTSVSLTTKWRLSKCRRVSSPNKLHSGSVWWKDLIKLLRWDESSDWKKKERNRLYNLLTIKCFCTTILNRRLVMWRTGPVALRWTWEPLPQPWSTYTKASFILHRRKHHMQTNVMIKADCKRRRIKDRIPSDSH